MKPKYETVIAWRREDEKKEYVTLKVWVNKKRIFGPPKEIFYDTIFYHSRERHYLKYTNLFGPVDLYYAEDGRKLKDDMTGIIGVAIGEHLTRLDIEADRKGRLHSYKLNEELENG